MKNTAKAIFEESIRIKRAFIDSNLDLLVRTAEYMAKALEEGRKILLFGNGGSSTDASHLAAEFVNRFKLERRALPALALNTDMAVLTSIGNDYSFDNIFSRQIEALGRSGDVAVAFSTSGGSENVLRGVYLARQRGMAVVVLTGAKGSGLASLGDFSFVVPSEETPRIQECHITIGHVLCELVETRLFADTGDA